MKRLETARLVLEPVTRLNAVALWRLMQSAYLREFQDVPRYARDEFERRVATRPKRFDARATGRFEWLVVLSTTNEAIGWISLRVGDRARGTAEIGYSILRPFRGSGYATEAARALVAYAFDESDVRRIDACCVPANAASRALLVGVGFEETRVQRNGAIVRGRPVDIVMFEFPRERWKSARDHGSSAKTTVMPASANPK